MEDIDTRSDEERNGDKSVKGIENDGVIDDTTTEIQAEPLGKFLPMEGQNNENFLYNAKTGEFKCKKHYDMNFGKAKGTLQIHFEAKKYLKDHGMEPKTKTDKKDKTTETEEEPVVDPEVLKIQGILDSRKSDGLQTTVMDASDIVLENILKDIADGASKLAKNVDLQYLYTKTKTMFPPEWTFELWVLNLVALQLDAWGIRVKVWQELDDLTDEQLEGIKQAKIDWNKIKQQVEE